VPGLKITLLQQPLIWMDGPANLRHFDRQLETVAGRDVIRCRQLDARQGATDRRPDRGQRCYPV